MVEFLYEVESTPTEGGIWVAAISGSIGAGGDEVAEILGAVSSGTGIIKIGFGAGVSLARLSSSVSDGTFRIRNILLFVSFVFPERTCRAQDCKTKTSRNKMNPSHSFNLVEWFRHRSNANLEK